jgi:site-specific DNA-methyltransferase (adenine-specific)
MKIQTLQIKDLTPDPNNARQHDDKNLKAIQGSLKEFGQRKPIVITEAGVIVAGNGTVEAAKRLGWLEIQAVTVPGDWTPEQTKAFALADNRTAELAAWNSEILSEQIRELSDADFPILELGFEPLEFPTKQEWENLFDATSSERKEVGQMAFTLHNDQQEIIKEALAKSKAMGDFGDTGNTNENGNALARIVELWLGTQIQ